jgi:hypothetical protein
MRGSEGAREAAPTGESGRHVKQASRFAQAAVLDLREPPHLINQLVAPVPLTTGPVVGVCSAGPADGFAGGLGNALLVPVHSFLWRVRVENRRECDVARQLLKLRILVGIGHIGAVRAVEVPTSQKSVSRVRHDRHACCWVFRSELAGGINCRDQF